jgi:hypothetical protein
MPDVISLQDLMEAFVEQNKESAAEERWEHPDIRFKEFDYGRLHIYFDKKPKDDCTLLWVRQDRRGLRRTSSATAFTIEQPAPRQPDDNCRILSMSAHRGVIWRVAGLHTWLKGTLRVGASSASDWKIASPSRQITPRCGRIQVV